MGIRRRPLEMGHLSLGWHFFCPCLHGSFWCWDLCHMLHMLKLWKSLLSPVPMLRGHRPCTISLWAVASSLAASPQRPGSWLELPPSPSTPPASQGALFSLGRVSFHISPWSYISAVFFQCFFVVLSFGFLLLWSSPGLLQCFWITYLPWGSEQRALLVAWIKQRQWEYLKKFMEEWN